LFVSARPSLYLMLVCGLAGCSALPSSGPSGSAVQQSSSVSLKDEGRLGYAFVKVSPLVVSLTKQTFTSPTFSRSTRRGRFSDIRIGVGDMLNVAIFETGSGGLFNVSGESGARSSSSINLPVQQVDAKGLVTVPYAGQIQVAGKTTEQVKAEIEAKLKDRAVEPQVVVSLTDRRSGAISVLGEVTAPVRFSPDPGGTRLLEAIARAGGTKFPTFEMVVTLQRRGHIEQVPLISAVRDAAQNVYLEQGDSIVLSREPRSFVVLGATPPPGSFGGQNNRRFLFESENLTLTEAVAKSGGLLTTQADARAVFIYRQEAREILARLGVDVSANLAPRIPTIYQIDLTEAEGYFLASELYVQDRDIIYISDAPSFEAAKFFVIISPLVNAISQAGRSGLFIEN
jgi:polysaccharide export outer membrane protein